MIKECPVIKNNELVTVVKYGGIDVQLPSIHKDAKTIFVGNENGRYFVVDDKPIGKPYRVKQKRKKNIMKTTTDTDAICDEINCENDIKTDNE